MNNNWKAFLRIVLPFLSKAAKKKLEEEKKYAPTSAPTPAPTNKKQGE